MSRLVSSIRTEVTIAVVVSTVVVVVVASVVVSEVVVAAVVVSEVVALVSVNEAAVVSEGTVSHAQTNTLARSASAASFLTLDCLILNAIKLPVLKNKLVQLYTLGEDIPLLYE